MESVGMVRSALAFPLGEGAPVRKLGRMRVSRVEAFFQLGCKGDSHSSNSSDIAAFGNSPVSLREPPYGIKVQLPLAIVPLDSLRDAPPS